jgi:hypothetical protein
MAHCGLHDRTSSLKESFFATKIGAVLGRDPESESAELPTFKLGMSRLGLRRID